MKFLLPVLFILVSWQAFADVCNGFSRPLPQKGIAVVEPDNYHGGKIEELYSNNQVKIRFFILSEVIPYDRLLFTVSSCNGVKEGAHAYLQTQSGQLRDLGIIDTVYSNATVKTDLYSTKHHDYSIRKVRDLVTTVRCDRQVRVCRGQAAILENVPGTMAEIYSNGYGLFEPSSWLGSFNRQYVKLDSAALKH